METGNSLERLPIFFGGKPKPETVKDALKLNNPLASWRAKERKLRKTLHHEPLYNILEYIAYEKFQPCEFCVNKPCNHWTSCELKRVWQLRKVNHTWRVVIETILFDVCTAFLTQDRQESAMYQYWLQKNNHDPPFRCQCSEMRYLLFVDKMHWRLHWQLPSHKDNRKVSRHNKGNKK